MRHLLRSFASLVCVLALGSCGGSGGMGAGGSVDPAPSLRLAEILPAAGAQDGGNEVSALGVGFLAAAPPLYVRFGGRVVAVTPVTDEVIAFVVPPGDAVGAVDVELLTGSGVVGLPQAYTYLPLPPPAPQVMYEPLVGQAGTRVDLTFAGFPALGAPTVTFGGIAALDVEVLGPASLRVVVPVGLMGGTAVMLRVSDGTAQVSAPGFFAQGTLDPGDVSLNELLPDPGSALDANRDGTASSAGDELVELVNRLGVGVDLTGWTLSDASQVRHTFPNPTTVPARGSIVIFGSGNPTYFPPRHATGHAQVASTGSLGMNNTSDAVILRTPAGTVVAQVNYLSADVTVAVSRNVPTDGQAPPVPAASADYVLHTAVVGAVGAISPGVRADQTPFDSP